MLGEALQAARTMCWRRDGRADIDSGEVVDALVQDRFERICTSSTIAVARWIAGEGIEVANGPRTKPRRSSASSPRSARRR